MFYKPFRLFNQNKIIHFTYHKMGTVWFSRILYEIASHYDLNFQKINDNLNDFDLSNNNIIFVNHSDIFLESDISFKGSHMVRDLRDVIVSGYFYHLKTTEKWANVPRSNLDGLSYKDYLNTLNLDDGLKIEIVNFKDYALHRKMHSWNYKDERILELKYEEVIINQEELFTILFKHYGFNKNAIHYGLEVVERNSLKNKSKKDKHIRSGKPGEWKTYFKPEHKKLFKKNLGELLIELGYEKNFNW